MIADIVRPNSTPQAVARLPPHSETACIALGSNLGDRAGNIRQALELLHAPPATFLVGQSSLIETAPHACPPGSGPFLNAACTVQASLSPRELLDRLLSIESRLGRRRDAEARNAPRTIDLDLLTYGDEILEAPGLSLPHPRFHERRFVLTPLAEVAPDLVHPVLGRTVRQLLEELGESG